MLHFVCPAIMPVCIELDLSSTTITRAGAHESACAVFAARSVVESRAAVDSKRSMVAAR
jgi:hypothetical protein